MKRSTVDMLASYIDALHPIIYINHFDPRVIDEAISRVGESVKCVEFNNALGLIDFKTKSPQLECSLEQFLKLTMDDGFENETFLILKDVHEELRNPKVIALLKRIAENNLYKQEYLPEKPADEIKAISNEIIESIETAVKAKASLDAAISCGRSKESWFASQVQKSLLECLGSKHHSISLIWMLHCRMRMLLFTELLQPKLVR